MKDKIWSMEVDEETKEAKIASDDGDSDSENRVSASNNRIYFYSEVSRPKVLSLNKNIQSIGIKLKNHANSLCIPTPEIYFHINILLLIHL